MDMKKHLFSLLFLLPLGALAQGSFRIQGSIEGIQDSTEIRLANPQSNAAIATAFTRAGKFELQGQLAEPMLTTLAIGKSNPVYLYVENNPMTLSGNAVVVKEKDKNGVEVIRKQSQEADLSALRVEGSRSHVDFVEFQSVFSPLMGQVNELATRINMSQDPNVREPMLRSFDSVKQVLNREIDRYVNGHRASYVSPFLLYVTAQLMDNPVVLNDRFQKLDSTIRMSQIGQGLGSYIQQNLIGSIGSTATDFTQADTLGKPVSLSSFRGKYVLLDFWASWCRPCRLENPAVVRAFQKFKKKNFTVLGVSLDQNKEAWLKAIKADNLTWTHVSDLQQWSNAVAQLYRVQGIPQNFLIDPTGKIIGRNLRGAELEAKLCEVLGCK